MLTVLNTPSSPEIKFIERFIYHPKSILQLIEQTVDWDDTFKVRKTASFGVAYQYSQKTYPKTAMPKWLESIAVDVEKEFGFLPNNCLLNRYENGDAKMGFHSDDISQMVAGTGVVIVILGSPREITYKNKDNPSLQTDLLLNDGSALYMDDNVQQEWLHAILPKEEETKLRVSLTFRLLK